MRCLPCLLALWFALSGGALAQTAGIEVAPPEGAAETAREVGELERTLLPVGSFADAEKATVSLTGQVTRTAWRIEARGTSTEAVMAGFRRRLAGQGFRRLLDCANEACGGFEFRFGAELIAPPAMRMNVEDFVQLTVGREAPAEYVSVLASRVRDAIWIQVVTVTPDDSGMALIRPPLDPLDQTVPQAPVQDQPGETGGAPASDATGPGSGDDVPVAGTSPPQPPASPADERTMLARLLADGHVPVEGLAFATGGAKLTETSAPALDEMAAMLSGNADLRVAIVGHSDNVGSLDGNIELSRRRAAAVRRALIQRGVRAARLEARGVGYLAPVMSNATEEGRAMNRRVELVLR